jgi:hypothetical protein
MSTERKKAELKPITKLEPKQRVKAQTVPTQEPIIEEEKPKIKRAENKYVRLALDANQEERSEFSLKVKNGEIRLAYYATESDKGYHYYLVIKK